MTTRIGLSDLDRMLGDDSIAALDATAAESIRRTLIFDSYRMHLGRDVAYREYAKALGAACLTYGSDLEEIPLLPTSVFKRPPPDEIDRTTGTILTTSSGTRGTVSFVLRDNRTLMRFFSSVCRGFKDMLGIDGSSHRILDLGPPLAEAENLWTAYAVAGAELLLPRTTYTAGGRCDLDRAIDDLKGLGDQQPVLLVGSPALMADLAEAVGSRHLRLDARSLVLTMGGWKRRQGEMIVAPELRLHLADAMGLATSSIRDVFNMVELNSAVFECAAHRKHVPPWLDVSARSPADLRRLPNGSSGLLAFLDPTPTSFPGFLLGDDFGRLDPDPCPCGTHGPTMEIERRVNRLEVRGCALRMSGANWSEDPGR